MVDDSMPFRYTHTATYIYSSSPRDQDLIIQNSMPPDIKPTHSNPKRITLTHLGNPDYTNIH